MRKVLLVLICVFFLINMTDAKSDKTEKYKLEYKFKENSSRTYLITYKQNMHYDEDSNRNVEYILKIEDSVVKSSKSKATIKRKYCGFKYTYTALGVVVYNNLDEKNEVKKVYIADVLRALQGVSYEFSISTSGLVSGIKGNKDIVDNALTKIFGKSKKSDKEETTYKVQGMLEYMFDKATLEAEVLYVYSPLSRSSLKTGSTWKAKPKRVILDSMSYDSPEEYKVEEIKVDNKNVMLNIKVRGNVEPKETKKYKVESNKTKGEFTFNQTKGEITELSLRTKAKYTFFVEESDEAEKKVESVNDADQTVEVKLVSSSTTGNPRVKIVTSMGDIVVELFEDDTPNTVANFIELCEAKFYDDIRFHRIIKGFMIQGGCPYAKGEVSQRAGSGDAGYKFADEFVDKYKFDSKGLLAMANSGPNTNGSQFFITLGAADWLNGKHTIFGKVIEGIEIVDKIGAVQTSKPGDKPVEEVYIKETQILQKRSHEYKVKRIN